MKYMNKAGDVLKELEYLKNSEKIKVFKKFFKTNKGEYGYGDMFWGISVPQVREISKRYFRDISFDEIKVLINHRIHEVRLTGYLILTYQYEKSDNEKRITNDFYEEKMRQYDLDTVELDEKIKRVEKVESSFYVTAGYIIELTKNSSKLFEVSKEEERRLLIKTVLLNITWDGEKLYYDYNSPFDLIVELNESTDWGGELHQL